MKNPPHPRPEKDFTIRSLKWERDVVAKFARAGFTVPSDDRIRVRFWVYLEFLQSHGFTSRIIAAKQEDVGPKATLRNFDVTDRGFRFIQSIEKKWSRRLLKLENPAKNRSFLEKWLAVFQNDPDA